MKSFQIRKVYSVQKFRNSYMDLAFLLRMHSQPRAFRVGSTEHGPPV